MTPPITVGTGTAVVLDAAAWGLWSLVVGFAGARLRPSLLDDDTWITRGRRWERDGRCYEAAEIRRWKDRLPEFGSFAGGRSKRHLPGRDAEALQIFATEARRAEYVHWAIVCAMPLFALWNPPLLLAAMGAYAVAANVPCIAVQRYNRLRINRIERRTTERRGVTA